MRSRQSPLSTVDCRKMFTTSGGSVGGCSGVRRGGGAAVGSAAVNAAVGSSHGNLRKARSSRELRTQKGDDNQVQLAYQAFGLSASACGAVRASTLSVALSAEPACLFFHAANFARRCFFFSSSPAACELHLERVRSRTLRRSSSIPTDRVRMY